jgi:hypothetical protein
MSTWHEAIELELDPPRPCSNGDGIISRENGKEIEKCGKDSLQSLAY